MRFTKILATLLALLLITAIAGCGADTPAETTAAPNETAAAPAEVTSLGEGQYTFTFTATFLDGSAEYYNISTDCATVGEALLALGLIEGEAGQFGLYVKSVCGVVADYNIDQTYWALYTDGEMAMAGVDSISSADVASVEFRVSK